MHIASFDNGSPAACQMLANELLDLWDNPIDIAGQRYVVVAGQIVMDGKGRESFCGVTGATSLAGCNLCHFEGRTFANRRVFDGVRRYLQHNDSRRRRNCSRNGLDAVLHYSFDETRSTPKKRTYDEYIASADIAEQHNYGRKDKSFNHEGVKKRFCFTILPYGRHIHKTVDCMHCFNNVIRDTIGSLRPSQSGDHKLFKHKNRSNAPTVIESCVAEGYQYPIHCKSVTYTLPHFTYILPHFTYILPHFTYTTTIHQEFTNICRRITTPRGYSQRMNALRLMPV